MYLRVSLLEACNLRCHYCLPEDARFERPATSAAELQLLTRLTVEAAGVDKIRFTGGEPTLCPELEDHVRAAKALVPVVGLTSNGIKLGERLVDLQHAGLTKLNISLDAPDAAGFEAVTRRGGFDAVMAAIRRAKALGYRPLKVNCVATRQTDLAGMVRLALNEGVQLRFIELMAIGEPREQQRKRFIGSGKMRLALKLAGYELSPAFERDEPTSRVFTLADVDPERCAVGFITTTSKPFCGTCNRIRLTSQGRLHTCLFDDVGHDLLSPLRLGGEDAARAAVRAAVARKKPPEHFVRRGNMAAIGG